MIPTWKTKVRDKKLRKYAKWLKIGQFYPLTRPENTIYEFSQGYGYYYTQEDT